MGHKPRTGIATGEQAHAGVEQQSSLQHVGVSGVALVAVLHQNRSDLPLKELDGVCREVITRCSTWLGEDSVQQGGEVLHQQCVGVKQLAGVPKTFSQHTFAGRHRPSESPGAAVKRHRSQPGSLATADLQDRQTADSLRQRCGECSDARECQGGL